MTPKTKAILATFLVGLFIIAILSLMCANPMITLIIGLILIGICILILVGFLLWWIYDYFYYMFKNNSSKE